MEYSKEDFIKTAKPLAKKIINYCMREGKKYGITNALLQISVNNGRTNFIENGKFSGFSSGLLAVATLKLYAGNKVISCVKNSLDWEEIKEAIDKNMRIIHLVPEFENITLLPPDKVYKGRGTDFQLYTDFSYPQQDLVDYACRLDKELNSNSGIKSDVSIKRKDYHNLIICSNGLFRIAHGKAYSSSLSATAEDEEGKMESYYDGIVSVDFKDFPSPETWAKEVVKEAKMKLNATFPRSGETSIVLNPESSAEFFLSVFDAIDGTAVYEDATFLKGKIGEQVMNKDVTIIDDPRIKKTLGSQFIDDAGIKSEKIELIKNGILKSYNMDLKEARQLGLEPIGRNEGYTNVKVMPGKISPEDLIKDIETGIYIKEFSDGIVDVNEGTYSRPASGVMIEKGKITTKAVNGFIVSGNLKEMFMHVALANDTPKHPDLRDTFLAPTTRIDKMIVSSRKNTISC